MLAEEIVSTNLMGALVGILSATLAAMVALQGWIVRRMFSDNKEALTLYAAEQKAEREQCANQFRVMADGAAQLRDLLRQQISAIEAQTTLLREHHQAAVTYMNRHTKGG